MFSFMDGRDWFFQKKLGMFIHLGLYSIDAWHEHVQRRKNIPRADYVKRMAQYNPAKFNPDAIIDLAQGGGMEFLCITTKHHDGFCLWDTKATNYNIMNTPYGKDLIGQLAAACHRRNFGFGLYYSVLDWHHPNYPHCDRNFELKNNEPGDEPNISKYMAFLKAQIRELCTNYGEICEFFWDINPTCVLAPEVNAEIRRLQPGIVINNRGFDEGDFGTPEREFQLGKLGGVRVFDKPTQAVSSVGQWSWGFKEDEDYYNPRFIIDSIAGVLARGGSYMLNIGPMPDGSIDAESARLIGILGDWFRRVGEAYTGAEPASLMTPNCDIYLTKKANAIYIHLCGLPRSTAVLLNPITDKPKRCVLLNDGRELGVETSLLPKFYMNAAANKPYLRVRGIPVEEFHGEVMVIKMEYDQIPGEDPVQAARIKQALMPE